MVSISVLLWAATCLSTVHAAPIRNRGCLLDNKYQTLVALLDLRSGASCKDVNLHGVQQLAIVQSTVNQINAEFHSDNVSIRLQVFDTCSTVEGMRLATLKALVASQQTCLETPFLLGFVGPERYVDAIRPITKVFKAAHVIPYPASNAPPNTDGVFVVSSYPVYQHTQAVKSLMQSMGVNRLAIIYELDELTKNKFVQIKDALNTDLCITASIALQDYSSFSASEHIDSDTSDAILILIENPSALGKIAAVLEKESEDLPATIIFSVARVGSIVWPKKSTLNIFILQMMSSSNVNELATNMDSSLLHEWNHQKVTECSGGNLTLMMKCTATYSMGVASHQQDWTLLPLHYALRLYSSAVRITRAECSPTGGVKCLQNSKWMSTLREASLFVKPENGSQLSQRVSFGMDMPSKFTISSVQANGDYQHIGDFESGMLKMRVDFRFNIPLLARENDTECGPSKDVAVTKVTILSIEDAVLNFLERVQQAAGLIGMIAGVCTGAFISILIAFYAIYRSVAPKSSARSGASSKNSTLSNSS